MCVVHCAIASRLQHTAYPHTFRHCSRSENKRAAIFGGFRNFGHVCRMHNKKTIQYDLNSSRRRASWRAAYLRVGPTDVSSISAAPSLSLSLCLSFDKTRLDVVRSMNVKHMNGGARFKQKKYKAYSRRCRVSFMRDLHMYTIIRACSMQHSSDQQQPSIGCLSF